jgi:hypothetical protein
MTVRNFSRRLGQTALIVLACGAVAEWPRAISAQAGGAI